MDRIRDKRSSSLWSKSTGSNAKKAQHAETTQGGTATKKTSSFSERLQVELQPQQAEGVSILLADGSFDTAALQELQDTIHQVGDKLVQNPRIDTAMEYKKAVQQLLQSIVPHLHNKQTHTIKKGTMTANGPDFTEYKFTIVTKINKKLDDVLKLILGTQTDQMKLMESLDEIKGLVVDLLQ